MYVQEYVVRMFNHANNAITGAAPLQFATFHQLAIRLLVCDAFALLASIKLCIRQQKAPQKPQRAL